MKARPQAAPPRKASAPHPEAGFASVVVLILTFVMIALLLGNTRVLEALKRDLQRVEQRQLARPANDASTAAVEPSSAMATPASSAAGTPGDTTVSP